VNPNLHEALLYPLRLAVNPTFKHAVAEHNPLYHPAFRTSSFVGWFHVVLAITAVFALARFAMLRRFDAASVALCLLFAAGTVFANRNRTLFGVAAVPVVTSFFLSPRRESRGATTLRLLADSRPIRALAAVVLLAFGWRVVDEGILLEANQRRKPAFGISRDTPVAAAEFLERSGLQGNMFNEYHFGGYLIWALSPERRVFIDGRNFVYGEALLHDYRRVLDAEEGFQAILDRHAIDYTVLRNSLFESGGAGTHPFLEWCGRSPDWTLVHLDDAAVVHARDAPINAAVLERVGFRYVEPFAPGHLRPGVDAERDREGIVKEIERLLEEQPDAIETRALAANLHASLGNTARAIEIYEALSRSVPGNADFAGNRGLLLAREGRRREAEAAWSEARRLESDRRRRERWDRLLRESSRPEGPAVAATTDSELRQLVSGADSLAAAGDLAGAIAAYEEAARLAPLSGRIRFGLGDVYYRSGRVEDCLREYHAALELDSTSADLLNNLGYVYGRRGDLERAREYWTRAAQLDPEHDAARNLRKLEEMERAASGE
jgi:tetratricopeptide (TPR) repeat protein